MANETSIPRRYVPMVGAVLGFLFGIFVGDVGLGIVFVAVGGFAGAVYAARRGQRS